MEKRKEKTSAITWEIHYVNDDYCETCGKIAKEKKGFLEFMCDAHTHGLCEYGHDELQMVLNLPKEMIAYILNTIGMRIAAGERFEPGKDISDILGTPSGKPVVIKTTCLEKGLLRLMLPDPEYRYPGDEGCAYPYNMQDQPVKGVIFNNHPYTS